MSASPPWPRSRRNRESTARQYELVARAVALGWPRDAVRVIDDDLGVSGASTAGRSGFAELVAKVGLGQVGIVLALEVSRLARNNADWYRLLDLAGMTDTLIADADGVYHPGLFNDRMLLGMKGTMSEAELHVLRARLDGGIRNKAARGELRRGLPVGLVWGEADGQIRCHPDEAVTGVIAAIFERFAVCGSVRGVWLWLREQGLKLPAATARLRSRGRPRSPGWSRPITRCTPCSPTPPTPAPTSSAAPASVATSATTGHCGSAAACCPETEWEVLITDHHAGSSTGTPTRPTRPASAPTSARRRTSRAPARSGRAARCCRGWPPAGSAGANSPSTTTARPRPPPATTAPAPASSSTAAAPGTCASAAPAIDAAVTEAFLAALQPAALQACLAAAQQLEDGHDAALAQWRRQVEQARYHAGRAERRYRAVDPDNRLVARGLETEWETALQHLADAEAELARREAARPKTLTPQEKTAILALGDDLGRRVVGAHHHRPGPQAAAAHPARRGQHQRAPRPHRRPRRPGAALEGRRDQRTVGAAETQTSPTGSAPTRTPSTSSAASPPTTPTPRSPHILNRQDRRTARGLSFTAGRVQSLRHHYEHPLPPARRRPDRRRTAHRDRRRQPNSASRPPPCTAGSATASSPANNSPPAHPGGSASPTRSAPCSSTTPPTAGWPCWRPPSPTACPAKPSCNVSSAANCKPSTSAPDAEKACVSSHPPTQDGLF